MTSGSTVQRRLDPVLREIAATRWRRMAVLSAPTLAPVLIDPDGCMPDRPDPPILPETPEERSRLLNQVLMQPYISAGRVLQPEDFPRQRVRERAPAHLRGFRFSAETAAEQRWLTPSRAAAPRETPVFRLELGPAHAPATPGELADSDALLAPDCGHCIVRDLAAGNARIAPDPRGDGAEPRQQLELYSEVGEHASIVNAAAREAGIDADLLRAVVRAETDFGDHAALPGPPGVRNALAPLHIDTDYWGRSFPTAEDLARAHDNVRACARMLRRIKDRLPADATAAQIATLYDNTNATRVSDYGMRVARDCNDKPWRRGG